MGLRATDWLALEVTRAFLVPAAPLPPTRALTRPARGFSCPECDGADTLTPGWCGACRRLTGLW